MASRKAKSKRSLHPLALFGILVVALAIPTTIFVLQQQQQTQSHASEGFNFCQIGAYGIHKQLSEGSTGTCVIHLQLSLRDQTGAKLDLDGKFGPKTKQAVINFQRWVGLTPDGIAGNNTWAALHKICDSYQNSKIPIMCRTDGY